MCSPGVSSEYSAACDAPSDARSAVREQVERLEAACAEAGRDPADVERVLLTGFTPERPLDSVDAFVETAAGYAEVGITEIVVHHPIPGTRFEADQAVFERVATDGAAHVADL